MENPLIPCLSGVAIAKEKAMQPYFKALKQLISAPGDVYEELYASTLLRFSEFCQAMPFSMTEPEPYSLLKQQLILATTALKLIRGQMLPPNSESESIAEQEPLWAYAVLTSSLFAQIQTIQTDRTIALYKNSSDRLGLWHPITGSLYEPCTYYQIHAEPNLLTVNPYLLRVSLLGKIIPGVALRWLAGCPVVFSAWWKAMVGETSGSILTKVISEAAAKIKFPLTIIPPSKGDDKEIVFDTISQVTQPPLETIPEHEQSTEALEKLMAWIIKQFTMSMPKDSKKQAFRVPKGYLVSLVMMKEFIDSEQQWESAEIFIAHINEFLVKDENSSLHCYRSVRMENRQRIQGIIIAEEFLSKALQEKPSETHFIPDIPL